MWLAFGEAAPTFVASNSNVLSVLGTNSVTSATSFKRGNEEGCRCQTLLATKENRGRDHDCDKNRQATFTIALSERLLHKIERVFRESVNVPRSAITALINTRAVTLPNHKPPDPTTRLHPFYQNMGVPSPKLYKLAATREYNKIPQRVETHPIDIYWQDRYGSTVLHLLCQDRSTEDRVRTALLAAVDAILQKAPEIVAWTNCATWSPMHFAAERARLVASADLILHLMEACPTAVSLRTKFGLKSRTPFHIACDVDASYRVLKAMLTIDPTLAVQPFLPHEEQHSSYSNFVENPLQLLWRNKHAAKHEPRSSETFSKMALLLQAAYCGTVRSRKPHRFHLVNAICTVRCPNDYASIILDHSALDKPDERGLLPIHHAVAQAHRNPHQYTQFVIQKLVDKAPETVALKDPDGRLPLHVAVGDGLTWHKGGVRELSYAYTAALWQPDPRSGLVPALQSAERATESRLHLSTTLELLLMAPEVVAVQSSKKPKR